MAKSDLVVIWGTNAAATQINVMTHALEARRRRKAPIVVIDTYRNATAKQADLFVCVRPGTDGALACAVMHVLFRDGMPIGSISSATPIAPANSSGTLPIGRRSGPPPSPAFPSRPSRHLLA